MNHDEQSSFAQHLQDYFKGDLQAPKEQELLHSIAQSAPHRELYECEQAFDTAVRSSFQRAEPPAILAQNIRKTLFGQTEPTYRS